MGRVVVVVWWYVGMRGIASTTTAAIMQGNNVCIKHILFHFYAVFSMNYRMY